MKEEDLNKQIKELLALFKERFAAGDCLINLDTCESWVAEKHEAMRILSQQGVKGCAISGTRRFGVTEWTVRKKFAPPEEGFSCV